MQPTFNVLNSLEYSILHYIITAFKIASKDLFHILHDATQILFFLSETLTEFEFIFIHSQ